jgi:hypothetical protein
MSKRKPGRPAKVITDDHLRQIEILAGYGLTEAAIAAVIGVCPATFRNRKADEERVVSALLRGQARAQGKIAKALFKKAREGDIQAIKWWEITRAGRSEKQTIEHTGEGGGPVTIVRKIVRAAPKSRVSHALNGNGRGGGHP